MASAPEDQLHAATTLGGKPVADDASNSCPVCRRRVVGLKPYVKHVGRHLEQLALFALPPVEYENAAEGDQASDDNNELLDTSMDALADGDDQESDGPVDADSPADSDPPQVCRLPLVLHGPDTSPRVEANINKFRA